MILKRVLSNGNSEVVEKKSRFLGILVNIENSDQAMEYVNSIRKKYYDARHNCFAYICGNDGEEKRFSDDGEPSGTAGKPIMDVLEGNNITNCLLIVTRYFGGTLLGTGGLVKAYGSAAKEAVENAILTEVEIGIRATVKVDYNSVGKIQYMFSSNEIYVLNSIYESEVIFEVISSYENMNRFEKELTDGFSGRFSLEDTKEENFYVKNNSAITI